MHGRVIVQQNDDLSLGAGPTGITSAGKPPVFPQFNELYLWKVFLYIRLAAIGGAIVYQQYFKRLAALLTQGSQTIVQVMTAVKMRNDD